MDFLDPQKKRSHAIRLMIGYVLVGIALVLATTLLLFAALGYGYNRKTGEVTQNGLLFVDAHPESARILLNGQDKGETDGRFVLETGQYSIELQRDGYRNWKRDFMVEAGGPDGKGIVRLVYPFMFPTTLVSKDLIPTTETIPDLVTASPDRRWIVVHYPNDLTKFQIIDTSTKQNTAVSITVPSAVFGTHTGSQSLELAEWSTDNRRVLLKHMFQGGYDYVLIDRDAPEQSINVTQTLGKSFTNMTLRDKKADQLYVHDAATGLLQSVNLKDKSFTTVVEGAIAFWPYKDDLVLYSTAKNAPAGKVSVHIRDGSNDYVLRDVAIGTKYLLNVAEFNNAMYVVAGSTVDGKVYIYKNPLNTLKKKTVSTIPMLLLKLDNPDTVTFSANARFIAVQAGSKFAIYDAETKQQHRYDTELALDLSQKVTWMDGHRLMFVSKGKVEVFDFDGLNKQTLVSANPAFIPMFDRDFTALFTYGPSSGVDTAKSTLVRTELKVIKN